MAMTTPLPLRPTPDVPPFRFERFALIVLGLGFLVALAYFLVLALVADQVVWSIEIFQPALHPGREEGWVGSYDVTSSYDMNVPVWTAVIIAAWIAECRLSRSGD